jgi:hypothetical protein
MEVEINPADVVSIPTDCNFQKLRTCKYKVVAEHELPLTSPVYASRYETEQDGDVDLWSDEEEEFLCSACNMEYNSWCMDCEQCGDCCECGDLPKDDEDEEEPSFSKPKTEVQLTLNLDNKIQSIDWEKQWVALDTLISHLFASRRPALAMTIRRSGSSDYNSVQYGVLLDFTTQSDAKTIYNELNP